MCFAGLPSQIQDRFGAQNVMCFPMFSIYFPTFRSAKEPWHWLGSGSQGSWTFRLGKDPVHLGGGSRNNPWEIWCALLWPPKIYKVKIWRHCSPMPLSDVQNKVVLGLWQALLTQLKMDEIGSAFIVSNGAALPDSWIFHRRLHCPSSRSPEKCICKVDGSGFSELDWATAVRPGHIWEPKDHAPRLRLPTSLWI